MTSHACTTNAAIAVVGPNNYQTPAGFWITRFTGDGNCLALSRLVVNACVLYTTASRQRVADLDDSLHTGPGVASHADSSFGAAAFDGARNATHDKAATSTDTKVESCHWSVAGIAVAGANYDLLVLLTFDFFADTENDNSAALRSVVRQQEGNGGVDPERVAAASSQYGFGTTAADGA